MRLIKRALPLAVLFCVCFCIRGYALNIDMYLDHKVYSDGVNVIGRSVYVYRETEVSDKSGRKIFSLFPGSKVILIGEEGHFAQVLYGSYIGRIPLNALAMDKDCYFILGQPGDSNKEMESRLEALGYFDEIPDDYFNLETAQAVMRFRVHSGLEDEFRIDDAFLNLLYSDDASRSEIVTSTLRIGDRNVLSYRLQKRLYAKGYLEAEPNGHFDSLTEQAVRLYQKMEGIWRTGTADQNTLSLLFSEKAAALPRNLMAVSEETSKYLPGGVALKDWWTSDIQSIYAIGVIAEITDIETGITWQEMRRGGTNHADVQPLTAQDTSAMKTAVGGTWSWQRRAIWVTIDGIRYAASMNCMPHGNGAIADNNFPGHHCIHFLHSRTHIHDSQDSRHQNCVAIAARTDYTNADRVDWAKLYEKDEDLPADAEIGSVYQTNVP